MLKNTDLFDVCRSLFGKPAFEANDVAIFQGDCVELMGLLPDEVIDLTITSPPYNIGKEYEQNLPVKNYVEWCAKWMTLIHRITKRDGAFWLNLGYLEVPGLGKAVPISYLLWDRSPFYFLQEVVWNYGAGVSYKSMYSPRNEKFLWYVKDIASYSFNLDAVRDPDVKYPNQKKNGKLKCNPLGKNPSDVWQFAKVTSGKNRSSSERTPHPAQFPIAVIDRIVRASSDVGDVVFDPFLGSGSTAEAALCAGRKVIGIELNPDYVRLATDRISNYLRNQVLASAQQDLGLDE